MLLDDGILVDLVYGVLVSGQRVHAGLVDRLMVLLLLLLRAEHIDRVPPAYAHSWRTGDAGLVQILLMSWRVDERGRSELFNVRVVRLDIRVQKRRLVTAVLIQIDRVVVLAASHDWRRGNR